MSAPIYDGGPAFPFINEHTHPTTINHGMTLRDYFAGQALAGFKFELPLERWWSATDEDGKVIDGYRYSIREKPYNLHDWEHEETGHDKGNDAEELAFAAYALADAMLAARERKEDAP